MRQPILAIQSLSAGVEGRQILKGINLVIRPGEVHAVMGQTAAARARSPAFSPGATATTSAAAK
jgi:ABC-type transport system involved in Fe-S cluster assembly, ATPase component